MDRTSPHITGLKAQQQCLAYMELTLRGILVWYNFAEITQVFLKLKINISFYFSKAMQEPGMVESLSKNITRQGLTNTTLNYLRVSIFIAVFREHSQMMSHKVGGGALLFVWQ